MPASALPASVRTEWMSECRVLCLFALGSANEWLPFYPGARIERNSKHVSSCGNPQLPGSTRKSKLILLQADFHASIIVLSLKQLPTGIFVDGLVKLNIHGLGKLCQ